MKNIKQLFNGKSRLYSGFTHLSIKSNQLTITHGGNMGNSIETSVNPNLKQIGFPTVDILKKEFDVLYENGHPDYMWIIKFNLIK